MGYRATGIKPSKRKIKSFKRARKKQIEKGNVKGRPNTRFKSKPLGPDDFFKVGMNKFNGKHKGFYVKCGKVTGKY